MAATVQTKSGIYDLTEDGEETLLFAGLAQGLSLPYECATGTCGTCRARVMEGEVGRDWEDAPGMAKYSRDKGDILLCQTRAAGACTVRVPAMVEENTGDPFIPRRVNATISSTAMLTGDVMHIDCDLEEEVHFKAGQFYVVSTPDVTGGRAYSMVNYAASTNAISFVVKRKPDGKFSDWLFDTPSDNAPVTMFGPLGKATYDPGEVRDFVCITGGSGIAGIMSILNHATDADHFSNHKGKLYFGVRTLADAFYMQELSDMVAKSNGNLEVVLALSDEDPGAGSHPDYPNISVAHGFVHDVASNGIEPVSDTTLGYVAGPPPMVDGAIRVLIIKAEMSPQNIRYDKFG